MSKNKSKAKTIIYVPEGARINNDLTPSIPPRTNYEQRRTSVGREAIKKITGK